MRRIAYALTVPAIAATGAGVHLITQTETHDDEGLALLTLGLGLAVAGAVFLMGSKLLQEHHNRDRDVSSVMAMLADTRGLVRDTRANTRQSVLLELQQADHLQRLMRQGKIVRREATDPTPSGPQPLGGTWAGPLN